MRVLFARCFGIGNAVMCVPALKALKSLGHQVDVLVGNTPDDFGAFDVMNLLRIHSGTIDNLWVGSVPKDAGEYDLAIQSMPFDGRWRNRVHFWALRTMDGRTRPDPSSTGLSSWKKTETEYQIDNIRQLGFEAEMPGCSFMPYRMFGDGTPLRFYLGVGYKKDAAGFWKVKHWGNDRYAALVKRILSTFEGSQVWTTGDMADYTCSIRPIEKAVGSDRFRYYPGGLLSSFNVLNECQVYVGNDTGMMHVAAAQQKRVVGIFTMENSLTKARPWCPVQACLEDVDGTKTEEDVVRKIYEVLG